MSRLWKVTKTQAFLWRYRALNQIYADGVVDGVVVGMMLVMAVMWAVRRQWTVLAIFFVLTLIQGSAVVRKGRELFTAERMRRIEAAKVGKII